MASPPDHVYFPPLGALLEGETVLLSWNCIASALQDAAGDRLASAAVAAFLRDPFVLGLLRAPATAFPRPSAASGAAFDTRTAAINVTPAPPGAYDVAGLKADAAWLSDTAGIDKVAALRVAVVELQSRGHAFLATPLSAQDAANVRKAAAGATTALPDAPPDADDLWAEFATPTSRRRRLFAVYLSERRSFALAADLVVALVLLGAPPACPSATQMLRQHLVQGLGLTPDGDDGDDGDDSKQASGDALVDPRPLLPRLAAYIAELRACMTRADAGLENASNASNAPNAAAAAAAADVLNDDLARDWVRTAMAEAVHYLAVVFLVLHGCRRSFLSPAITAEWFRFAGDYGFLDGVTPDDDAMAELVLPLKTLVCVNSLLLLNLNRAIGYLDHDLELDADEEPYVNDADALHVIHAALVGAANAALPTASPVFLSWSLVLHRMDMAYQERVERRDLTQNQRAQDGFELDNAPSDLQPHPRRRRSSVGSIVSIEPARYDAFLSEQVLAPASDAADALVPRLAMTAIDQCRVYDVVAAMAACAGVAADAAFRPALGARLRLVFLDLLKASFPIVGYQADPLTALLAVLSGDASDEADSPDEDVGSAGGADSDIVARAVLRDDQLMQFYVQNALSRFPYEFTPFVALARLLAAGDVVMDALLQTPTITFTLPAGFGGYAMTDDPDHDTATMLTTDDLPLFPSAVSRQRRLAYQHDHARSVIPADCYGRFMIDGSGIVNLDYEHSALALLGKRLDANLADDLCEPILGFLSPTDVADAIRLLTALVRAEIRKAPSQSAAAVAAGLAVLQEASRDLEQAKDVVSVVCDTIDTLIQDSPAETDEARLAVLAACVDFLRAILPLCPGRVWSYMARCQLLNTDASAGRLCILTGASDVVSERFRFLMAAVRFLAGLVDNAMTSAVQRTVAAAKTTAVGSGSGNNGHLPHKPSSALSASSASSAATSVDDALWLGASDKTMAQVSLSIAQTVVDVYENTSTWKFASEVHRARLVAAAVGVLRDVVGYASSLAGPPEQPASLVACFGPAAYFVLDSFLSSSSSSLRFQPLLTTLLLGLDLPQSTLYTRRTALATDRVVAVLQLAAVLLKLADHHHRQAGHAVAGSVAAAPAASVVGIGGAGGSGGKAPPLEAQIFQIASLPARLCAFDATLRPALDLLTDVVVTSAARANEPPSLLGYLGPQVSRSFLDVLLAMDKPFRRSAEMTRTWRFFSTILRHRQQWMANCLLTGKTPREALQTDGSATADAAATAATSTMVSAKSALAKAKDALRSIATLPHAEALAVLDFFTAAQNYWPWTIFAVRQDDEYLTSMRAYVRGLAPSATMARTDTQAACHEARIATYVAESLAMQLYHLRQMGTEAAFARGLVPDLDYYLRDGVAVAGYNLSLHANFQRNFAQRYPGCALDQFKRSLLLLPPSRRDDLGPQFYYALDVADRMLAFDGAWSGASDRRGRHQGFQHEMQTANLNLSLVDAQIALFHAWRVLLLELSVCLLPHDGRMPVVLLQLAEQCLTANQTAQGPERVFATIAQSRASLALLLLQRLAEYALLPRDVSQLLLTVWASITSVEHPWSPEQAPYYRTLLRILYVVLRGARRGRAAERASHGATGVTGNAGTPLRTVEEEDGRRDSGGGGGEAGGGDIMVATTQTVLNVLDRVVAQGFRTLVSMVHDDDAESRPEDLALLTAVLQACLSLPGMGDNQTQVLNIMASHDVLHVAMSLFSWSDRLLVDDRDPVYGELSLLFLLELSALPVVAEQLACDGFLSHLTAASLAAHMRRPGISPFAETAAAQRCYSIWAKALLPLLVNIIIALGTSIAPEIAYVLNQFPHLLASSVQRIEAPGLSRTSTATLRANGGGGGEEGGISNGGSSLVSNYRSHQPQLTLLAVNEVHSLALLTRVLQALRVNQARAIPPVAWDAAPVLESVDFWLSRPKLLRERLVPLGTREVEWRAAEPQHKGGVGLAESQLEEKVLQLMGAIRTILSDDDAE